MNTARAAVEPAFDLRKTFPSRVAILGAARSGCAAAEYFRSKGVALFISDTCTPDKLNALLVAQGLAGVPHEGGGHSRRVLDNELIVLSPGVPADIPILLDAAKQGIPVWSEIELAFRATDASILAVTGSTGKSTTVMLLGEALRAGGKASAVGGNIGTPLITVAAPMPREGWVAAEISSFQLETIDRFRPRGAAVLNLLKNHLDRYRSEEDYYSAKKRIAQNFSKDNYLVLNVHDVKLLAWAETMQKRTRVIFYGHAAGHGDSFWYDEGMGKIRYRLGGVEGTILDVKELRINGRHNYENVAAAAALAKVAGINDEAIGTGLGAFGGLPHRLEFAGEVRGVRYYNDSKSTTAESVLCAVTAFIAKIHLIAGGRDKGCDFSLVTAAIREKVGSVSLIGEAAGRMAEVWQGSAPIKRFETLDEAVLFAAHQAKPGDVVVFSPGCSSYDMFVDYEDRGNCFKKIVVALSLERIVR